MRSASPLILCSLAWVVCLGNANPEGAIGGRQYLVVLKDTGRTEDGLPVFMQHPDGQAIAAALDQGFNRRMLRLYYRAQVYLHRESKDPAFEPAFLLLSGRQGGFARFGFVLDRKSKPHAGYVDLHESHPIHGKWGAMDQIFPHELGHLILRQLAGEAAHGGSNQVHALGVRTDPQTALSEGFSEHFQIMAVDDPEAESSTKALAGDSASRQLAYRHLREYQRELLSRWAYFSRERMAFPLWFSGAEQVLRYYAVKENSFAIRPDIPESLTARRDLYAAYLWQNIVPGDAEGLPKSLPVMISTEGVVSCFFYRLISNPAVQQRSLDAAFYREFGSAREEIQPLENAYLKVFFAISSGHPQDLVDFIRSYSAIFPDEKAIIDAVARRTFGGQPVEKHKPIWLANPAFLVGSSLFDQFRGQPRVHTFDLNAATLVDLMAVPEVDRALGESVLRRAPFDRVSDLMRVPGMSRNAVQRFEAMEKEMQRLRDSDASIEESLSFRAILSPYLWRLATVWIAATALAGFILRRISPRPWLRLAGNAAAAAAVVFILEWGIVGAGGFRAIAGPLLLFGLPAGSWCLIKGRSLREAGAHLLFWLAAGLPAVLLVRAW